MTGEPYACVGIDGIDRPMCSRECASVSRTIADHGLTDFYRHRQAMPREPAAFTTDDPAAFAAFDDRELQDRFTDEPEAGIREAHLILEGVACAACVRLIETRMSTLKGIRRFDVNYATRRATVRWDSSAVELSAILGAIAELGYKAHPYDPKHRQALLEKERKDYLLRIGLAALFGMQVMMIAIALYIGGWSGIESQYRVLFHWASLVLTIPIVAYSAQPFLLGAYRDLRARRVGMDVPIAIGLSMAFVGSLWATVAGGGQVYYDSVAMLVVLLLGSRYLELKARQQASAQIDEIERIVPALAIRIVRSGSSRQYETVPVSRLCAGDCVLVKPGEVVPVDGLVVSGHSSVDESLVTGESTPIDKPVGSQLISGSTNVESPLQIIAQRVGGDMVISQIRRLVETAHHDKPRITQIADEVASWFVAGVLAIALAVAVYWWYVQPAIWISATIAVLVVSCPCALSIATPAALTAAIGALLKNGVATVHGRAIETLASATHYVFDKTGTLTAGVLTLRRIRPLSSVGEDRVLALAQALARESEHPVAHALMCVEGDPRIPAAAHVRNHPGQGVTGLIGDDAYVLGSAPFIARETGIDRTQIDRFAEGEAMKCAFLAGGGALLAVFYFADEVRPGALDLIRALKSSRVDATLMSGDHRDAVVPVAVALGIEDYRAALKPEDKLAGVIESQDQGAVVAMIGDGINDAPVLAQAHVSIAMGNATDLAKLNSDMIVMGTNLDSLRNAIGIATKTRRVIRQNLVWAVAYNALAIPAAATGHITPWMAAIGMSLSSLLVVANAGRIGAGKRG